MLRRGVRVRHGAPKRAPIANLEVANVRGRPSEERDRFVDLGVALEHAMARRRADAEPAIEAGDPRQALHPVDVDQMIEARQAQRQHWHQTLAPGENLRVVAVLGEQRQNLLEALGTVPLEGCRLHRQQFRSFASAPANSLLAPTVTLANAALRPGDETRKRRMSSARCSRALLGVCARQGCSNYGATVNTEPGPRAPGSLHGGFVTAALAANALRPVPMRPRS